MRSVEIFVATDGERFDSAEACKVHEADIIVARLVGLTKEQLEAAIAREDVELGDAIEAVGNRIAKKRRDDGDHRRKPAKTETASGA